MARNPYTITFGREPAQSIPRLEESEIILRDFTDEAPSQQVYIVTGVRGCGKTVFMTEIANRLKENPDWVVVEVNSQGDILKDLASKLSSDTLLAKIFRSAKINLSFLGLGLEIKGTEPITNMELAVSRMLESLKKKGKRVLVALDEVTNTKEMQIFTSAYQIFIRQDLPIFLLMTGLYENIDDLQNEKGLTFLYRAPKLRLKSLNLRRIAKNYQANLGVQENESFKMAASTRGYAFAFQVLGYCSWENGGDREKTQDDVRQYLDEYVYDKIWSELSAKDHMILYGIALSDTGNVGEIREQIGMDSNTFSTYRSRLIKKGLVESRERGSLTLTLPAFDEYIKENMIEF